MNVTLMRGLPGSGKTTWLQGTIGSVVCSADHYHMVDGVYRYNPANAGLAHGACLKKFVECLIAGRDAAVDNTNTSLVELVPYARLAEAYGAELLIVTLLCDVAVAIERNTHGVPASTILAMHANMVTQPVPPYWKHQVIA